MWEIREEMGSAQGPPMFSRAEKKKKNGRKSEKSKSRLCNERQERNTGSKSEAREV
jgi:hypothetical protein